MRKMFFLTLLFMNVRAHILKIDVLENNQKTKRVLFFGDRRAKHEDWGSQSAFLKTFFNIINRDVSKYDFLLEDPEVYNIQALQSWFSPVIINLLLSKKDNNGIFEIVFQPRFFRQYRPFETALSVATAVLNSHKKIVIVYAHNVLIDDVVALLTYKDLPDSFKIIFTTEETDPDEWQDTLFKFLV